jgi:hypothetical protein
VNGPQRYSAQGRPDHIAGAALVPDDQGPAVLFADVEHALRDSTRLMWLLPIISGDDDTVANRRTAALGAGLRLGLTGLSLVDYAMEGCPE